ncbi:outer membrane protein assembly factor BamB family protein, partial [Paractinoplanes rishiriensis]|uniref:outer membrane protein assembly factor BamB family protein n=1 Tax=Paractinoplanes rishiriensis TaxID=1050105 RepID=UPI001940B34D
MPGWEHPGYDAEDSFYNPGESAINTASMPHLTRRWSVQLRQHESCPGPSAPLVATGRVIATDDLGISAYQALTGKLAWRYNWPDPLDSDTPYLGVAGNVVIAANSDCNSASDPDGTLTALDLATGRPRWTKEVDIPIYSALVDKNLLVISGESMSDELGTFAYRVSDGQEVWRKMGYLASSVSANGRMLLNKGNSTTAVAVADGAALWTKSRKWLSQSATPAADRFLVTEGMALLAVNAATGAIAWTAPGKAADLLATDGRRVYRASGRTIEAVSAANGRLLWSRQQPTEPNQPVRAGGLLFTGGAVLNPVTGAMVAAGTPFAGKQVIAGGRLFTVNGSTLSSHAPRQTIVRRL